MPGEVVLSAENLRVRFGYFTAVSDVSFDLRGGELLGLIGPNGSGKTTLLRAVAGIQPLARGVVRVLGEPMSPSTSHLLSHIGFTPDTPSVYEDLSVRDFLRFIARGYEILGQEAEERIDFWLEKVWLTEKADMHLRHLSRGMRQRVGIARTLLPNPSLVLLDEPSAGLDPAGRVQFRQLLCSLREQRKALIVSSHILLDMAEYCTHIGIMSMGQLIKYGTVAEIAAGSADVSRCRYTVTLAHAVAGIDATLTQIEGLVHVPSPDGNGDRITLEYGSTRADAALLLARLIELKLPVAAFTANAPGLEEAYLRTDVAQVDWMALMPHNNALAWVNFRRGGGPKYWLIVTAVGMVVMGIAILLTSRLTGVTGPRMFFPWTNMVLVLEAITLILLVPTRINALIRQDIQSRMIESHRLMPLPAPHAVAGYILGSATPAAIVFIGLFLVGLVTAANGGVSPARWAFANLVLIVFAGFLYTLSAYASFGAKFGAGLIFVPLLIAYMSQGGAMAVLPGIAVLLSPVIGHSIFDLRGTGFELPGIYAASFAAEAYFATLCFIAAARKYRRADAIGMDTILGVLLVVGWVAVSAMGLRAWDDFAPRGWMKTKVPPYVQLLGSMIAAMLLAVWPIAANARERIRWRWHERIHDPAPMRRPPPVAAVILIVSALIMLLPLAPESRVSVGLDAYFRGGIAIAMTLAGLYFLIEALNGLGWRAAVPAIMWIMVTWVTPILTDLLRFALADYGESERIAGFCTASPAGTLIILWMRSPIGTTPGLLIQALVAGIPLALWILLRHRRRAALPL